MEKLNNELLMEIEEMKDAEFERGVAFERSRILNKIMSVDEELYHRVCRTIGVEK